ncbi:MAG: hypothetical protein ACJA1A_001035 [Saprospiraceae bacterium]|jgi:hypothetical protein|tara:strand:+ start:1380 stop:1922 length:543 start_codon:yes stop_codon:yes gene_type:complete
MQYFKILSFAIISSMVVTSCSPRLYPFTDNVYEEFDNSSDALSKIQFYLSGDIVLYRDFGGKSTTVENGTIKIVDGRRIEEVTFKKGTPGVFVFSPKRDRVAISFEAEDDKYLMFGPNQKAGGRFVLLAKEWKKNRGKVTYADQTWNTTSESAYSNLLVDLDKARNTKYKKITVSGRKVN